jgi:hypothetical protein
MAAMDSAASLKSTTRNVKSETALRVFSNFNGKYQKKERRTKQSSTPHFDIIPPVAQNRLEVHPNDECKQCTEAENASIVDPL